MNNTLKNLFKTKKRQKSTAELLSAAPLPLQFKVTLAL